MPGVENEAAWAPGAPRIGLPGLLLACLLVAGPATAGMLKYTDSQGRLHFVQDIGQVPPEYRSQVEKQPLKRDISVTHPGRGAPEDRIEAMEERSRRLEKASRARQTRPASPPAAPKDRLAGAPEPDKYERDCWWQDGRKKCRRTLTEAWKAWDEANGGENGKAVTRRKVGR